MDLNQNEPQEIAGIAQPSLGSLVVLGVPPAGRATRRLILMLRARRHDAEC